MDSAPTTGPCPDCAGSLCSPYNRSGPVRVNHYPPGHRVPGPCPAATKETPLVTYADNPKRLARLLRDLAEALESQGVNPSGSSPARHLMDDAQSAARELDPPKPGERSSTVYFA